MKKILLLIAIVFLVFNQPALASKIPSDLYKYIKDNLKGAKQRFDSVIVLPDGIMYIPLYPAQKVDVEKIEIIYTYPSSTKTLAQRPEVVIFNNNYVLLKLFKNKAGKYSITSNEDLPVKVKLGVMPQDMLVPPGLVVPENLRLILGDLHIPSPEDVSIKVENSEKPIKFAPIAELKNKKMYAISPKSKYLLALDPTSSTGLYELKLNGIPQKILTAPSLGYAAVIYFNEKFIDILDLRNERIVAQVKTDAPLEDLSVDTSQNIAYATSPSINAIYVVDLNSLKLTKRIKVSANPQRAFSAYDGKSLVYSDKFSGDFFLLDLKSDYLSSFILNEPNTFCAILKDEDLYTISRGHSYLNKTDPFAKLLKGRIPVSEKPVDMLYYNEKLYILSAKDSVISVFDLNTGKMIKSVKVDSKGFYTKITKVPNKHYAVVTGYEEAKLVVMDLDKMSVVQKRPANGDISGLAIIDISNGL